MDLTAATEEMLSQLAGSQLVEDGAVHGVLRLALAVWRAQDDRTDDLAGWSLCGTAISAALDGLPPARPDARDTSFLVASANSNDQSAVHVLLAAAVGYLQTQASRPDLSEPYRWELHTAATRLETGVTLLAAPR
jgi:hypothetical protein